jgi:transcriptional regulator with XRE-family HTH domain
MKSEEFRKIRLKLGRTQLQFSELLGLSGIQAVSNIETDVRNCSKLTATFLRVLDALPNRKAEELIDLFLKYGSRNK